ncbi:MAG TPA: bifunctional glycosyltransferase family 2/GtrA family protein [Streptosporangiaceae bacterium]|nr:bifunctional glycosyltransferase family 2/GtrA family protein [Streptosporangiaceae bacterium]
MTSPDTVLSCPDPVRLPSPAACRRVQVEIVIPVRNEERDLAESVRRLHGWLTVQFPFGTRITIADNGSTDGTWGQAMALQAELAGVKAVRLERPGRGGALRSIWSASDADVYAYMDVDLSTDLNALFPLVAPLLSGHSDVAIGTRLARGARVVRGPRREFISRGYNLLLHATLGTSFSDAQCGFKAIRAPAARQLLPLTTDDGWFFDTELLVLAEHAGLRIHEVPVDWIDDPDSRVKVASTATGDIRGIIRLGTGLARGTISVPVLGSPSPPGLQHQGASVSGGQRGQVVTQLARFVVVGVGSTLVYVALYLLIRQAMNAQAANAVSLLVTAIANTAVNRRFTFGIRGRARAARHQVRGLIAFGIGLAVTSGALAVLHAATAKPGRGAELAVLVAANLVATVVRFALYRQWVFGGQADARVRAVRAGLGSRSAPVSAAVAAPQMRAADATSDRSAR